MSLTYCKKCGNIYNIAPVAIKTDDIKNEVDIKIQTDVEFIEAILKKKDVTKKIIKQFPDFRKSDEFKNLSILQKEYVNKYVTNPVSNESHSEPVNYHCKICFFSEKIKPGSVIFSKSYEKYDGDDFDDALMIYDNTLPRTFNYICRNDDCSTHKKPNTREAIFFRKNDTSYNLRYVCTICKKGWNN